MKILFNLGLVLLLAYLIANAALSSDEGERPVVQLIAGLGILSMLAYCAIYGLKEFRITRLWPFAAAWVAFSVTLSVYFLLALADAPSDLAIKNPRYLFVCIYIVLTTFFVYYGVINRHITEAKLLVIVGLLLISGLLDVYEAVANPRNKLGVDVINTSSGYVFVMLLPLLMYKYRDQGVWVFLLTLVLTAITGKRGALVIYAVLMIYSLINFRAMGRHQRVNYKTLIALGLASLSFLYFFEVAYESLQYRIDNFVDSKRGTVGSGRDILWLAFYDHWSESDLVNTVFGSGYFSTLSINGFVAHNDFIQYLVDYGLFGLLLYLVFLYLLFSNIRRIRRIDTHLYLLLMSCFIIFVGRGLFAGTIRTDQIYWSISFGYLLGMATIKFTRHRETARDIDEG